MVFLCGRIVTLLVRPELFNLRLSLVVLQCAGFYKVMSTPVVGTEDPKAELIKKAIGTVLGIFFQAIFLLMIIFKLQSDAVYSAFVMMIPVFVLVSVVHISFLNL